MSLFLGKIHYWLFNKILWFEIYLNQLDIEIKVRKNVYTHIAESGFDKDYGARPLRRAIQNEIEDVLSAKILDGSVKKNSEIRISYSGGKIQFDECE